MVIGLAVTHERDHEYPENDRESEDVGIIHEPMILDRLAGRVVERVQIERGRRQDDHRDDRPENSQLFHERNIFPVEKNIGEIQSHGTDDHGNHPERRPEEHRQSGIVVRPQNQIEERPNSEQSYKNKQ